MKYLTLFLLIIAISSCVSEPREGKYRNYTYEEIIKRHGKPKYDDILLISNNSLWGYEIEPNYTLFFSFEELENGIEIRRLQWEKRFNITLIIWMKNNEGRWIIFDS